jgi:formate hydrogenlyase subunit 3/multisubunit Na+/H+ antiporter MnhD subunit
MRNSTTTGASGDDSDTHDTIGAIIRGAGVGLAPAAFLYLGALIVFGFIALMRVATAGLGFLTQLPILNVMSLLCLVALAVGFTLVSVRVFRLARAWREDGETTAANALLWGLGASALLILVPVLLGILLPQHPAYITCRVCRCAPDHLISCCCFPEMLGVAGSPTAAGKSGRLL